MCLPQLAEERAHVLTKLVDRDSLARLPDGSFGRAYLDFVERENISAAGIRAAADQGMKNTLPALLDYVSARMRDTHDLWHVVTGYSGDVLVPLDHILEGPRTGVAGSKT
jgi:ubiquinone biosynthesis protein COQ4